MNNNENKSSNNFVNGLVIGALIGAGAVFLLGTKKGKKLLRAVSEEGMDNISSLLEKADKAVNVDEFDDDEEEVTQPRKKESQDADKSSFEERIDDVKEEIISTVKPKAKRFFRGISKRIN